MFRMVAAIIMAVFVALPAVAAAKSSPASEQTFGQWHVRSGQDNWTAYTKDASGRMFGMTCYKSCNFVLAMNKPCKDGETLEAMMSGPLGEKVIPIHCWSNRDYSMFDIDDPDLGSHLDGNFIGFALALADGMFAVARFSLEGAKEALAAIGHPLPAGAPQRQGNSGSDDGLSTKVM